MPTLDALCEEYLAAHVAEANTLVTLRRRLKYARDTFGELRVDRLEPRSIGAWRKRLPEGSAWHIHKALRQVLGYAVRVKLLDENSAKLVPNPEPKRREVSAFTSPAEVEAVADELPASARSRSLPRGRGCGRRSGSRWSAATSTAIVGSCTSGASTQTGR